MTGPSKLESILKITESTWHVEPGPLMSEFQSTPANDGESLFALVSGQMGRESALELLDRAGVRGRAGGGFPTGHKWWLVATADAPEKYFVCNANLAEPGRCKESWFILTNPSKVIEAVAIASYCTGSHRACIAIPEIARDEIAALESALGSAYASGLLSNSATVSGYPLDIQLVKTPSAHLAGEETALLEFMEGRELQPRKKPPVPTSVGLFGKPTAINNLETVLQCRYALKAGVEAYRTAGVTQAPGTMVFTLRGAVSRPGLYELPLGTPLREAIFSWGNGISSNTALAGVFPGGIGSAVLTSAGLDTPLDFDSLRDAETDLGSGVIIVMDENTCPVELAERVAQFFHAASCGKCAPCKDGTGRAHTLISRIEELEKSGVDISERMLPPSKRPAQSQLTVLNNLARGISYTDSAKGLDKVLTLCEFFKYRGDCHHSVESATTLISLIKAFPEEFEHHMRYGMCTLAPDREADPAMAAVKAQRV
jgi:NADH-quinone oxidoreductase subunit F